MWESAAIYRFVKEGYGKPHVVEEPRVGLKLMQKHRLLRGPHVVATVATRGLVIRDTC